VAINTNGLALGSSMPAKTSFQGQSSGAPANQVNDEQNSPAEDPGNSTGSSQGTTVAAGGSTGTQKAAGPSAQTRGNSRSRTNSAGSTSSQSSTEPQGTPDTASTDFGSVMASALGRSTTTTPDLSSPNKPTADANDSTTGTSTSQPAAANATDAVAWIAQVLMPATAGAQSAPGTPGAAAPKSAAGGLGAIGTGTRAAAASAAGTANAAALTGLPADADSVATDPQATNGFATQQLAAQNALAAAQSRTRANANALPSSQMAQASDEESPATATPATTAVDAVNALAGVQKLISGLTDATTTDADADGSSTAPLTHPAAAGASTDVGDAVAALQAAGLTRLSSGLGSTTLTIHASVGSTAFADDVTTQVTGLAQSGVTQAQLQLNPADMGPVQVHITMQAGQASVWFGATHADTRAALEQSLPRLRELFAGAGMPLTDSGVFREPPQQQQPQALATASGAASTSGDTVVAPTVTQVSNIRLSLLDTYA
jgi:flagellar hook-length control protein FliK